MGLLAALQRRLIYYPKRGLDASPGEVGLACEDAAFTAADGVRLHGWWIPAEGRPRGTVLFCHGNAGTIARRLPTAAIWHELGWSILLFDYRGYGRSDDVPPDEAGTYRDAEAAWRYLVEARGVDPGAILVHGRSLGGAVAARLAAERSPRGLVLESTFTSLADIAADLCRIVPVRWILRYEYPTLVDARRFAGPKLVIHSPQDRLIPFAHGRRLFAGIDEPKAFVEISGGHNDGHVTSGAVYVEGLRRFADGLGG